MIGDSWLSSGRAMFIVLGGNLLSPAGLAFLGTRILSGENAYSSGGSSWVVVSTIPCPGCSLKWNGAGI
jgi:hypothetical protein